MNQMIEDGEDCFGVRNDLFLTSGAASKGSGLDYCPSAVYLKLDIQPWRIIQGIESSTMSQ